MKKTGLAAVLALAAAVGAIGAAPGASAATRKCDTKALQHSLDEIVKAKGAPGILATVGSPACGRVSLGSGVADIETGRRMRGDERIRMGSVTKSFTATVVLQLVAEGKIKLDAPVTRYLPNEKITVRDLLQHTSGLADYTSSEEIDAERDRFKHFEPEELFAIGLRMPRSDKPWNYSSTNYALLAMIVKQATGNDIGKEITRRIIKPLKLTRTWWPGDNPRIPGRHARGYLYIEGERYDATKWNMTYGGAGGALVSTTADLNRYWAALLGGRLVPKAQLKEMRKTVPADPARMWPGANAGLGLYETKLKHCAGTWIGHGGGFNGYRTIAASSPDGRRQVTIAINRHPNEITPRLLDLADATLCALR
ncbi:peptidase [Spongiactinospora rosea]|uniref:Peptidase n=1 Tax=Spongiactinospora rosea TaxID=2248750 RepID=A0A366LPK4_9ACTN|nr:serine hydrolase domain-containing protein [Spongiactinospora rosea]RBQ15836.1 peptidase [Spongiactinospora rosea]